MLLYQKAFGSAFDPGIVIPDFFADQSYKNDVCPCFVYCRGGGRVIVLWVDFEAPEKREYLESQRYTLELHIQGECRHRILETDSPEKVTCVLASL
ncbi:hypothetical protein [Endozoicomonas sp.]|uniref:hypothetical protein n=1 Tax=Endozoicomonas sp. TaxID=1892382 RepID=UPI0028884377|nr:hypothetical protein [Endozoicomonas sp.]